MGNGDMVVTISAQMMNVLVYKSLAAEITTSSRGAHDQLTSSFLVVYPGGDGERKAHEG